MKEINVVVHKCWKGYIYRLNGNEKKQLSRKIIFEYDAKTTLLDLFKYLNLVYRDIILNFEELDIKKINYKRMIKARYRILHNNKNIYVYDLNSKVSSLIQLFGLDKIEIFYTFFGEFGGRILEAKGMQFYMHSKEQGKHNLPHIHVKYQNQEVVISLDGKILAGRIKENKQKLAKEIIVSDNESLLLKWNNITDGEKFFFKKSELIRFDRDIE